MCWYKFWKKKVKPEPEVKPEPISFWESRARAWAQTEWDNAHGPIFDDEERKLFYEVRRHFRKEEGSLSSRKERALIKYLEVRDRAK